MSGVENWIEKLLEADEDSLHAIGAKFGEVALAVVDKVTDTSLRKFAIDLVMKHTDHYSDFKRIKTNADFIFDYVKGAQSAD